MSTTSTYIKVSFTVTQQHHVHVQFHNSLEYQNYDEKYIISLTSFPQKIKFANTDFRDLHVGYKKHTCSK